MNEAYTVVGERFRNFFLNFKVNTDELTDAELDDPEAGFKYMKALKNVASRKSRVVTVKLDDLVQYLQQVNESDSFLKEVERNILRYRDLMAKEMDELLKNLPIINSNDMGERDVDDMFILHREQFSEQANRDGIGSTLPKSLTRRFEVSIIPRSIGKSKSVRQLRGEDIGSLVQIRAMVTRVTEVKPKMTVACYSCTQCAGEIFQEITSSKFMPVNKCHNTDCSKATIIMQTRGSRFVKYQEIRIQELAQHVPVGHTPRSMTVHAKGHTTRAANPGDIVTIAGVYLPSVEHGYTQIRQGLLATTFVEPFSIVPDKRLSGPDRSTMSPQNEHMLNDLLANSDNIYNKLSQSLAPEIFGHEDVKKALLLLLVGGVGKDVKNKLKIRGDLNICLMGDPGVAKSQLLKYICTVAPRGIYTTGKGSSGVGLTASIQKDPLTDELVLEGGALVLADKGICAIDEFDKMDESDRTAIYEVMEQQTISIAKASITTSLNARTSILAAANPLFGRYNDQKSLNENINLPAALLSRFDVLFLLLDRPSIDDDMRLAEHVTHVHTHNCHPDIGFEPVSIEVMRAYVAIARQVRPVLTPEVCDYLVGLYVGIRERAGQEAKEEVKTTPRTLLSLIRLSTALARIRLCEEVSTADVDEADRLLGSATMSLNAEKRSRQEKRQNYKDYIYVIISQMLNASPNKMIDFQRAKNAVLTRGYSSKQFESTLNAYMETAVFMVDDNKTVIKSV